MVENKEDLDSACGLQGPNLTGLEVGPEGVEHAQLKSGILGSSWGCIWDLRGFLLDIE